MARNGTTNRIVELFHDIARIACRNRLARSAEVRVHVDETWHEIGTVKIDNTRAWDRSCHSRWLNRCNATILHRDSHVRPRLHVLRAVQNCCIDKRICTRLLCHNPVPRHVLRMIVGVIVIRKE